MSSASGTKFKQDMPPPGGYEPFNYKRVPAKTYFSGYALFGAYIGITLGGFYLYYLNCKTVRNRELELKCANMALYPMLRAERDRAYLKQLRRNRDEETKLMANVPGWKTGTWYGEPIYYTKDKDELIEPTFYEYYVHADGKSFRKRAYLGMMS